jgi:hypothetical protein
VSWGIRQSETQHGEGKLERVMGIPSKIDLRALITLMIVNFKVQCITPM